MFNLWLTSNVMVVSLGPQTRTGPERGRPYCRAESLRGRWECRNPLISRDVIGHLDAFGGW